MKSQFRLYHNAGATEPSDVFHVKNALMRKNINPAMNTAYNETTAIQYATWLTTSFVTALAETNTVIAEPLDTVVLTYRDALLNKDCICVGKDNIVQFVTSL